MKALIALTTASLGMLPAMPAHADLSSGLVAHWTFDDCNGVDVTERGHDLSLFGSACAPGPRKLGLALSLNGTSDYASAAPSPDFYVDTAVTYSAWINPSRGNGVVLRKGGTGGEDKYVSLGADLRIHFYLNNCMSGLDLPSAATVALNEWTHVAVTYDGTFARIYLNGQASGLRETTPSCNVGDNTYPLFIGRSQFGNPVYYWQGALDDIRVYLRSLTDSEVSQLYHQSSKAKIQGTAPWFTEHTVTCKNITQGTEKVLPPTRRDDWNCEGPDLPFKSGDTVQVVIDGVRQ